MFSSSRNLFIRRFLIAESVELWSLLLVFFPLTNKKWRRKNESILNLLLFSFDLIMFFARSPSSFEQINRDIERKRERKKKQIIPFDYFVKISKIGVRSLLVFFPLRLKFVWSFICTNSDQISMIDLRFDLIFLSLCSGGEWRVFFAHSGRPEKRIDFHGEFSSKREGMISKTSERHSMFDVFSLRLLPSISSSPIYEKLRAEKRIICVWDVHNSSSSSSLTDMFYNHTNIASRCVSKDDEGEERERERKT